MKYLRKRYHFCKLCSVYSGKDRLESFVRLVPAVLGEDGFGGENK